MHTAPEAVFQPPLHGWMQLSLRTPAGAEAYVPLSYTPNDFLSEFLAATSLAAQGVEGAAFANAEPAVYEFVFTPEPAAGTLGFVLWERPRGERSRRNETPELTFTGEARSILLAFLHAVERLGSTVPPEAYRAAMRREFPISRVRELARRLRGA